MKNKLLISDMTLWFFLASLFTSCQNVKKPTEPISKRSIEYSEAYSNDGEFLEVKAKGTIYSPVTIDYLLPGDSVWNSIEGDDVLIPMKQGKFGYAEIMVKEKGIVTYKGRVPIFMGEIDSDIALEQAINMIGVDWYSLEKGTIIYQTPGGFVVENHGTYDKRIEIRCRGPPSFKGFYWIDLKGSADEKPQIGQVPYDGYLFILPVKSVDEIIYAILFEKYREPENHPWPQINPY